MNQPKHDPEIVLFAANTGLLICLFSLGYVLADGWVSIDSSRYRSFLYVVQFLLVPLDFLILLMQFAKLVVRPGVLKPSLHFGAVLAVACVVFLYIVFDSSADPAAQMAVIGLPLYGAFFFLIGLVGSVCVRSIFTRPAKDRAEHAGAQDGEPAAAPSPPVT